MKVKIKSNLSKDMRCNGKIKNQLVPKLRSIKNKVSFCK